MGNSDIDPAQVDQVTQALDSLPVFKDPSASQTITQPSGTGLFMKRMESIRFADQFTSLQAAIDDLPANGGIVYVTPGTYNLTATLTVTKSNVWLMGFGQGGTTGSAIKAGATTLSWTGATGGEILRWGNQSDHIMGGGIQGIEFKGNGTAARALHVTDAQGFDFRDIYVGGIRGNAGDEGVTFDNNLATANPTGLGTVSNLSVDLGGSSGSASGIGLRGTVPTGVHGINFDRIRITHFNGNAINVVLGDGCTWNNVNTFRTGSGTGYGVDVRPVNAADPVSGNVFIDTAFSGGGSRIETSGGAPLASNIVISFLHYGTGDSSPTPGGAGAGVNTFITADNGTTTFPGAGTGTFSLSGAGPVGFYNTGGFRITGNNLEMWNGLSFKAFSDAGATLKSQLSPTSLMLNTETMSAIPRMAWSGFESGTLSVNRTFTAAFTPDKGIKITRVELSLVTAGVGCTTAPKLRITDGTTNTDLSIPNSVVYVDSGVLSVNYATRIHADLVAGAGCTTAPQNGNFTVQYRMQ